MKIKQLVKSKLTPSQIDIVKQMFVGSMALISKGMYPYAKFVQTPIKLVRNKQKERRKLEIGPGKTRIQDFETVNVIWSPCTDYIEDASKKLPFQSDSFDLVYGSHVFEHIPWYQLESVIAEWVRVLKRGGELELWVPNGLLIAQTFVSAEVEGTDETEKDGWYKFNSERDPCVWANGRIFSYGDGKGQKSSPNWHMSLFSPRFLEKTMKVAGLENIEVMPANMVRGYDHGWINMGMKGTKP
jgi:SAM-dependent methyltransferase